jgi:hypothetical protein
MTPYPNISTVIPGANDATKSPSTVILRLIISITLGWKASSWAPIKNPVSMEKIKCRTEYWNRCVTSLFDAPSCSPANLGYHLLYSHPRLLSLLAGVVYDSLLIRAVNGKVATQVSGSHHKHSKFTLIQHYLVLPASPDECINWTYSLLSIIPSNFYWNTTYFDQIICEQMNSALASIFVSRNSRDLAVHVHSNVVYLLTFIIGFSGVECREVCSPVTYVRHLLRNVYALANLIPWRT